MQQQMKLGGNLRQYTQPIYKFLSILYCEEINNYNVDSTKFLIKINFYIHFISHSIDSFLMNSSDFYIFSYFISSLALWNITFLIPSLFKMLWNIFFQYIYSIFPFKAVLSKNFAFKPNQQDQLCLINSPPFLDSHLAQWNFSLNLFSTLNSLYFNNDRWYIVNINKV